MLKLLLFIGTIGGLSATTLPAAVVPSISTSGEEDIEGAGACLPAQAVVLGGAVLGAPAKETLRRLGTPLFVRTSTDEDDGGTYVLHS